MINSATKNTLTKKQVSWLLWGSIISFALSALFHFGHDKTGFVPFSVVCAINESIWEHMKILFFGSFFFNLILYFTLFKKSANFIVGSAVGLTAIVVAIPALVATYSTILGVELFIIDFILSILISIACQVIIYCFMKSRKDYTAFVKVSISMIGILIVLFVVLGIFPPDFGIFKSLE